jgi:diguanylate cyclase (GGDEF)-like protein/PAS domain S-box-containing protein
LTVRVQSGEADDLPHVHRLRTKAGSYRWFETNFQRVREGETATDHIHLSSRDITERREAEDALRDQTERLRSILASMGDGVMVLGADRRMHVINAPAQRFIAIQQGEFVPQDWAEQFAFELDGVTPFPLSKAPLTRALAGEAVENVEMVVRRDDGVPCTLSLNTRPLYDGEAIVGCVAVLHDMSDRRAFEQELHESEERMSVLANASFDGVAITGDRRIIDVNQTLIDWVGRAREQLIGSDGLALFASQDQAEVAIKSAQGGVYEARLVRADGSLRPIEVRGSFANYRGESVRIAVIRDISERLRREAELKEHAEIMRTLSLRDELTGLYNRRGFVEVAGQALRTLARSNLPGCLFFADLDGLKAINDSLGHEMGDRVIAAAGKLLAGVFRDSDIVARLGGDEFAILAIECGLADIPSVLERIENRVAESNRREPLYAMSLSVGTALFEPPATADLNGLMDQADQAMYDQKRLSRQRRMA